ncbi:YpfB family protein [Caldibacillus thermolactis]|jgi:hypothetical protein|uniref:YpfB family protein n=1 Tax=Pallidibacillus thermolactis TaxID=251051 RepID=A0ABT2WDI2_9BACI|nr:YpfB family protein [Pallidibacillus thermolactis]MCU9593723.1 YpfB family protein [Pallidibacillus thermolactis]MCU9599778.1 YpfB family protein [Pallidibacillus thermolactis subsp. kokeshiiformis]MED1673805.1 YpfB family protein [Pallidibacillus thermolactis subsp. kokeshiiformis]
MKRVEQIIIKLIIIQGFFLLLSQILLHHYNLFPEWRELILYEGVGGDNFTKIVETFNIP